MRFLVAGVGAVGGFVAARLADAGHDVTLLARPHSAARLRDDGLRLQSQDGVRVVRPTTEDTLTAAGSSTTSSLTRDLIDGRHTEVDAVLADLAARAEAAGTATPLIDLAVLALRIHNRQIES